MLAAAAWLMWGCTARRVRGVAPGGAGGDAGCLVVLGHGVWRPSGPSGQWGM